MKPKHALIPMISLLMIFVYATTRTGYGLTLPTRGMDQWLYLPAVFQPMGFTVNTIADAKDVAPGDGFCRTAAGQCSLRAAVQEANTQDEMAFIYLPGGHYTLTITGRDENAAATGDLDITNEVQVLGAGVNNVIIDANQIDRVFHIKAIEKTVTISGVTITGGYVTVNAEEAGGGGIFNEAGYLIVEQTTVTQNEVHGIRVGGGGIYNSEPRHPHYADTFLEIRDSVVSENLAQDAYGGGILAAGDLFDAFNVTITHNLAATEGGGINASARDIILDHVIVDQNSTLEVSGEDGGGGIHFGGYSFVTIQDSVISNNTAYRWGGGILNRNSFPVTILRTIISGNRVIGQTTGTAGGGIYHYRNSNHLTIEESSIIDNHSAANGGGIYVDGYEGSPMNVNIRHSTIAYNQADSLGAGIYNADTLYLTNVTLSGNQAIGNNNQEGGGIYNTFQGVLGINNCTIVNNAARLGGGIYRDNGTVTIRNSIIAQNTVTNPTQSGVNCYGEVTSNGHNLQNGNSCSLGNTGDMSYTNPIVGPLQANGGPTVTHALLAGSPAIDAGPSTGCSTRDQRGVTRPQDGNGDGNAVCDIGAFEK